MEVTYRLNDFEGPLDLLLALISKNKMNILDVPLIELVDQYLEQISAARESDMEVASEFLEMAARLIYLKTVSLLPRPEEAKALKEELTGELTEYAAAREAAEMLRERDDGFLQYVRPPEENDFPRDYVLTHDASRLLSAYLAAVGRGMRKLPPKTAVFSRIVARKIVAVSTKIVFVLRRLRERGRERISALYRSAESRSDLVAIFLAVLELCKDSRVTVTGDGDGAEVALREAAV